MSACASARAMAFALSSFSGCSLEEPIPWYCAVRHFFAFSGRRSASIVQYSLGTKFEISASRSAMILSAADCTRPALSPFLIFVQRSGLMRYPTIRSRIRLACWASTISISIWRGCFIASLTAFFVISLNVIRKDFFGSRFNADIRCQLIASPSRSGSVAR